eukprot:Filipodium_phascolosomae@DN5628_c0_g1_i1.p1
MDSQTGLCGSSLTFKKLGHLSPAIASCSILVRILTRLVHVHRLCTPEPSESLKPNESHTYAFTVADETGFLPLLVHSKRHYDACVDNTVILVRNCTIHVLENRLYLECSPKWSEIEPQPLLEKSFPQIDVSQSADWTQAIWEVDTSLVDIRPQAVSQCLFCNE